MPTRIDTSYCRFCYSLINVTCASAAPVNLRWYLDVNGPPPPLTLLLLGGRGWSSPNITKSVPQARKSRVRSKRVVLLRLFFINEGRTKYVSVILSDERVDAIAEGLPMLRDGMCDGNPFGCRG